MKTVKFEWWYYDQPIDFESLDNPRELIESGVYSIEMDDVEDSEVDFLAYIKTVETLQPFRYDCLIWSTPILTPIF